MEALASAVSLPDLALAKPHRSVGGKPAEATLWFSAFPHMTPWEGGEMKDDFSLQLLYVSR